MKDHNIEWGRVEISLLPGGEAGWSYFSDPVSLKYEGQTWIDLSLEQKDGGRLFGAADIFEGEAETADGPLGDLAAAMEPGGKTFRIGIRLKEDTDLETAVVYWRAVTIPLEAGSRQLTNREQDLVDHYFNARKEKIQEQKKDASDFYISGTPKYLYKGNKFMFSCRKPEGETAEVVWKVNGIDAGTIDRYGLYTAPDRVGVFEIEATLGNPVRYRTTVFVMIKEPDSEKG